MKKLLILGIVLLSVFLIYLNNLDKKVYYVSLGDSLALGINGYNEKDYGYAENIKNYFDDKKILEFYTNDFSKKNIRIIDLINDINDNVKVSVNKKDKSIKNSLIKADLVTLSIGMNDLLSLSNSIDYKLVDEKMIDMEKLFILIREYCKEDIMVLNYYNNSFLPSEYVEYANKKLKSLCNAYNIHYIDISGINPDYFKNPKSIFPSSEGYKYISDIIIKKVNENILKR